MITKTMTAIEVIETLFFVSFFIKGIQDIWFMPFIMVMYLIFPLIYKVIKKYDLLGLLTLLLIVLVYNLFHFIFFQINYYRIELALTRIPVFLLGVYFDKMIYQKQKISLKMLIISIFTQIIITIILYVNLDIKAFSIFARYLYCILTICSVINISVIYSLFKNKNRLVINAVKFIGMYSLEIYLIFEKVEFFLKGIYKSSSYVLFYILCFLITLVLSCLIKKLVNILVKLVFNLYQRFRLLFFEKKCLN